MALRSSFNSGAIGAFSPTRLLGDNHLGKEKVVISSADQWTPAHQTLLQDQSHRSEVTDMDRGISMSDSRGSLKDEPVGMP
jgi:hypothetical protein